MLVLREETESYINCQVHIRCGLPSRFQKAAEPSSFQVVHLSQFMAWCQLFLALAVLQDILSYRVSSLTASARLYHIQFPTAVSAYIMTLWH